MAKTIFEYKDDYNLFNKLSILIAGMALENGISGNYISMIFTAIMAIIQKKMANAAYKNSAFSIEYQYLNNLTACIREELVKNIQELDMANIEGIFAYYCFVLKNKYLSHNRDIPKYPIEGLFNEDAILAALTLNNHGVCRNIAPFLTDLYHDFNIDSQNVLCDYFKTAREIVINADQYITEDDIANLESKQNLEESIEEINNILDRITKDLIEKGMIGQDTITHHCINIVNSEDFSYLFDPATYQFYTTPDDEGKFYSNRGDYLKVMQNKKMKKKYKNIMTPDIVLPHPIKPPEEIAASLSKNQKHIEENIDVIEQMHKDIEPFLVAADDTYKLILLAR
ncbi:MAG: hypothetical protein OSJ70_10130 [Bacilli bacterium]|nr:hypothetical protein [Bacilli bacterium]